MSPAEPSPDLVISWTRRDVALGPLTARYRHDPASGRVDLTLLPTARAAETVARRAELRGVEIDAYVAATRSPIPAEKIDGLVQIKELADEQAPAFSQGSTLRNSGTVDRLRLTDFIVLGEAPETEARAAGDDAHNASRGVCIRATLTHTRGWRVRHELSWRAGAAWATSRVIVENPTAEPIALELLASFSLAGITPFAADDAPGRLVRHRFRSVWSMEGRLDSQPVEDLQLERSWAGWGVRCERFGSVGSMPVRNFFPFVAVEDSVAKVTWAARLDQPGSWQLEVYRRDDGLALSGGLADREFGHWMKSIPPSGRFESPRAFLTCVEGGIDEACDALLDAAEHEARPATRREQGLPIIVNEWATTWGSPTHDNLAAIATRIRNFGARYLVIDAGWFAPESGPWHVAHGDWTASSRHYPRGLRAAADAIRAQGLVPGLWFEMETCGADSRLFSEREDLLLHRDGRPLTASGRRFLDFRKQATIDYLGDRVVGALREGGFGYLKIDYNETIGLGVDGAESLGEGLRQHLEGVQAFFRRIREALPELVVENCSSGGHRLDPSFFALSEMSSFSDAHESPEIPIIAANLLRLVPLTQSQIWVVLRANEPRDRTVYSLAAGLLGRFCLSGDILSLEAEQDRLLKRAIALYGLCESILQRGRSRRHGPSVGAYRHARGWQAVTRLGADGGEMLVVAHRFGGAVIEPLEVRLPPGEWRVAEQLDDLAPSPALSDGVLCLPLREWQGQALRLVADRPAPPARALGAR